MFCKKCGTEIQEGAKYCVHCGNELEGEIQCADCKETVNEENHQCENGKIDKDRKNLFSIITNSVILVLCLGLVLILLSSVARQELSDGNVKVIFSENVVEFIDASINGISEYHFNDFLESVKDIGQYNESVAAKINVLNIFMVDERNEEFLLEREMIYLNSLILIAMVVLPLVLLGLTIKNFIQSKETTCYKKLFLVTLLLSLILFITIPLIGYSIGIAVILYFVFSSMGLLYSFIIEHLKKERQFNGKRFVLRFIPSILLISLIYISTSHVLGFITQSGVMVENHHFGNFALIINKLISEDGTSLLTVRNAVLDVLILNEAYKETHEWVTYVTLLIPIFLIPGVILMIISLIKETAKNINIRIKKCPTTILSVFIFILVSLSLIATIITTSGFNDFLNNNAQVEAVMNVNIIIATILSFVLVIYQLITKKYRIE